MNTFLTLQGLTTQTIGYGGGEGSEGGEIRAMCPCGPFSLKVEARPVLWTEADPPLQEQWGHAGAANAGEGKLGPRAWPS